MDQDIRFCRTADDVTIAYATSGQGRPLVKVANWLSHLEFDWQSPVWRHWLETFSAHRQLIRYDERGCGLSDREVERFSLDAWVDDLEAVVDVLGLERFPLLGISRGGPVAVAYAARHPQKVTCLILYGAYARGWHKRRLSDSKRQELEVMNDLIRLGWGKENPAFRQVFTSLFMPEATAEQMQWFNDLQRVSAAPETAVLLRQTSGQTDVTGIAPTLDVPALILHAREDAVVPFDEGRLLASLIPGAKFVSLESKNHILLQSEPAWPHFLKEVGQFLGMPELGQTAVPIKSAAGQATRVSELTLREREVLALLAQGMRNDEIADALVISSKTVRNYISIIFNKLDVSSRGEAIVRARELGFGQSAR